MLLKIDFKTVNFNNKMCFEYAIYVSLISCLWFPFNAKIELSISPCRRPGLLMVPNKELSQPTHEQTRVAILGLAASSGHFLELCSVHLSTEALSFA